jgi:hypothetical protein
MFLIGYFLTFPLAAQADLIIVLSQACCIRAACMRIKQQCDQQVPENVTSLTIISTFYSSQWLLLLCTTDTSTLKLGC